MSTNQMTFEFPQSANVYGGGRSRSGRQKVASSSPSFKARGTSVRTNERTGETYFRHSRRSLSIRLDRISESREMATPNYPSPETIPDSFMFVPRELIPLFIGRTSDISPNPASLFNTHTRAHTLPRRATHTWRRAN